jgi:hypothetical protein
MPNVLYNQGKYDMLNREKNGGSAGTFKVALVTSSYTADADHDFFDTGTNNSADPSYNELTVSGYSAQTATITVTEVDASDNATFAISATTFTSLAAGQTIAAAILYRDTGTPTTSPLIAYQDVTDTPTNGSNITIGTWTITLS